MINAKEKLIQEIENAPESVVIQLLEILASIKRSPQETQVVMIIPNKHQKLNNEEIRTQMQKDFKKAGIETDEQILELIRDVKKELLQERFKCKKSF